MQIKLSDWEAFYAFLLVEVKLKPNKETKKRCKYIYGRIANYLSSHNLDWSRQAFNLLIADSLNHGLSDSYRNNLLKTGKHLDKFLGTHELEGFTYFKERPKKDLDVLSPEEMEALINLNYPYQRNSKLVNARMSALLSLMWDTGCRINETALLVWSDVKDTGDFQAVIFRDTKSNEDRTAIITTQTYRRLMALPPIGQYVFSVKAGVPFDKSYFSSDLKNRAKYLKITKPVRTHLIRHSMISLTGNNGMPVKLIMNQVGHKSMKVTERYLHNTLTELKKSLTEYHPSFQEELPIEKENALIRDYATRHNRSKRPLNIFQDGDYLRIELGIQKDTSG